MLELEDIGEYIFPIHAGAYFGNCKDSVFKIDENGFLGTGFLITKTGLALTAAHCLPKPDDISGKSITKF